MPHISPDQMFSVLNLAILPFWVLLAIAPRWHVTQILVHSILVPILLGATYAWLFVGGAFSGPATPANANFNSLEGVMALFTVKEAVVAGWVHYLVFDLFIGAWIVRDAGRLGINHLFVLPCLVLTLLLGPIGLLLYSMLRMVLRDRFGLIETA